MLEALTAPVFLYLYFLPLTRGSRELSVQQARIFLGHGLQNLVIYSLVGPIRHKHSSSMVSVSPSGRCFEEVTGSSPAIAHA